MVGFSATILLAFVFFPLIGSVITIIYLLSLYKRGNNIIDSISVFILGALISAFIISNNITSAYYTQEGSLYLLLFVVAISPVLVGLVGIIMILGGNS